MAALREVAVVATEPGLSRYRVSRRHRIQGLTWVVAGLGALTPRPALGQSRVDLLTLLYGESGSRTQVLEQMILLHQDLGESLGVAELTLTHDTISGASPTGAYPKLDVTTSASGTSSSSAYPQARDDNHRNGAALSYARRFGAHLPSVDVSYSKEDDYVARSAGVSDAWTLFEGRGTLHFGASTGSDLVEPVTNALHLPRKSQSYAVGWTWVLGPEDLFDVSVSRTKLHGYLDEPYKVVPVAGVDVPDHRPGTRTRDVLMLKDGHYLGWDAVLRTTYRFYKDDWSIRAHTLDLVYDQRLDDGWSIAPELRFYTQTAASFYGSLFPKAQPFASSDYRLSPFASAMAGLTVGCELADGLVAKAGATYEVAHGRDRIIPLAPGSSLGAHPVFSGPSSSSADLNKYTFTLGLSWRY
jgi:hypothetical protein